MQEATTVANHFLAISWLGIARADTGNSPVSARLATRVGLKASKKLGHFGPLASAAVSLPLPLISALPMLARDA